MDVETLITRSRNRRALPEPRLRRLIRESARLSQNDVAQVVGVNRSAVSRLESGQRTPRDDQIEAYLGVLDRLASER